MWQWALRLVGWGLVAFGAYHGVDSLLKRNGRRAGPPAAAPSRSLLARLLGRS